MSPTNIHVWSRYCQTMRLCLLRMVCIPNAKCRKMSFPDIHWGLVLQSFDKWENELLREKMKRAFCVYKQIFAHVMGMKLWLMHYCYHGSQKQNKVRSCTFHPNLCDKFSLCIFYEYPMSKLFSHTHILVRNSKTFPLHYFLWTVHQSWKNESFSVLKKIENRFRYIIVKAFS